MSIYTKYGKIEKHFAEPKNVSIAALGDRIIESVNGSKIVSYGTNSILLTIGNTTRVIKVHTKQEKLENEESILRDLNHPNIIKLYSRVTIQNYTGIELEQCNIDFLDVIRSVRLNEKQVGYIGRTIGLALKYLHDNNIVYRDLKPENTLLSIITVDNERRETIKLCDFEYAHKFTTKEERVNNDRGTAPYAAPEIYLAQYYRYEPDIWSFGVTLYTLYRRKYLFRGNYGILQDNICNYKGEGLVDDPVDLFVSYCLVPMEKRPTIDDLLVHSLLSER